MQKTIKPNRYLSLREKNTQPLWNKEELKILRSFNSPESIQAFLDRIPYNPKGTCLSPRGVMRYHKAHCMEGALFAAAALEFIDFKPILVYIIAVRDDGHALAIFKKNGKYGSLSKSNCSGLRYRSPIYRSIREVVLSYFDNYFNRKRELTLRAYTHPLYLTNKLFSNWQTRESDLDDISDYIDTLRTYTIVTSEEAKSLRLVDDRLFKAGMLGTNKKGLYKI
jgi:hypothetical protein